MSSIFISLREPINIDKLLKNIQILINKNKKNIDDILKISIISIDSQDTSLIPKIEYKGDLNEG